MQKRRCERYFGNWGQLPARRDRKYPEGEEQKKGIVERYHGNQSYSTSCRNYPSCECKIHIRKIFLCTGTVTSTIVLVTILSCGKIVY